VQHHWALSGLPGGQRFQWPRALKSFTQLFHSVQTLLVVPNLELADNMAHHQTLDLDEACQQPESEPQDTEIALPTIGSQPETTNAVNNEQEDKNSYVLTRLLCINSLIKVIYV
jgi:hypothetical protein